MNVCELRIRGIDRDAALAAARWELFVFPAVRHVCRLGPGDRAAVLYEGSPPDLPAWIGVLGDAGYPAEPLEPTSRTPSDR